MKPLLLAFLIAALPLTATAHDWYERDCCDTTDCRPISGVKDGVPWSEITDMGNHYIWQSRVSNRTYEIPKILNGFANPNIRPSRDGFFHGCEPGGETARCIYAPSFM